MANAQFDAVIRHIRRLADAQPLAAATDAQLVERFVRGHEETAFGALLHRHGPMVLGVCRGVLGQLEDAEDVFQATFMVLARKAGSIRKQSSVASWLHGVAYRLAVRARARRAMRRIQERKASAMRPSSSQVAEAWRELRPLLDEEMAKLPEKYRAALVLCYWEGKTQEEAAGEIGCPVGTVRSRLARARNLLQKRLTRRGLTLSAGSFTALVATSSGSAAVGAQLQNVTLKAALQFSAGKAASHIVSPSVALLVEAGMKGILGTNLKIATVMLVFGSLALGGVGLAAHQVLLVKVSEEKPQGAKSADAAQLITAEEKHARTDLYGDPLPEGAIARIGSIQWRHTGLECLAFMDGGKSALTAGKDRTVRTWDVATGKLLRSVSLQTPPGYAWPVALSPDGKTLVGHDGAGKIVFWATETGKEIKSIVTAGVGYLQFSPDGKTIAGETGKGRVSLWDWRKGKELALPGPEVAHGSLDSTFHICFSPDGRRIAVGVWWMQPLRIYETATGREIHQFDCRANCSALSPDGKRLATVSQGMGGGIFPSEIRLIELSNGKELARLPLGSDNFFDTLSFSPDGKMLACGGYSQSCLVDLAKGEVRHRLPGLGRLAFVSDGKVIAGKDASRLRFFDTGTGKEIYDRPSSFGGVNDAVDQIAVSPNEQRLASASQRDCAVYVWDTATGKLIQRLPLSREKAFSVEGLAFAPDSRTLLVGRRKGQVEFWDALDAKQLRMISLQDPVPLDAEHGFGYFLLHASADGKQFCTVEQCAGHETYFCKRLAIWESATGKLVRDYSKPPEKSVCSWSPDGLALALPTDDGLELRDVDSGQIRFNIKGESQGGIVAASLDQRLIAVLGTKEKGRPSLGMTKKGAVGIWEAATGKEIARIVATHAANLALVGGGRCLVTTDETFLRVWDLATGKEHRRWPLPSGAIDAWGTTIVSHLIALPNGRRVVTTLYDGTALIWDLSGALDSLEPLDPNPGDNDIAAWWADLTGDDARRAYAAVWRMAEARRPAIGLLNEHLQAVPGADAKLIRQHIRNLDSDSFVLREKAFKELEAFGNAAMPALREALQKDPSPELRRRVERLLQDRPRAPLAPDVLRRLRALHVLELIGSEEARDLLAKIAGGASYAVETQEAKAALERLNRRSAEK